MGYEYYNANVVGRFTNDCVIRAISTAENKTWKETYQELSEIAGKQGIILDDVDFVEPLLDSRYERTCERSKTVGEFAENHPHGIYLVTMKRTYFLYNRAEQLWTRGIAETLECGVRGKLNKSRVMGYNLHYFFIYY